MNFTNSHYSILSIAILILCAVSAKAQTFTGITKVNPNHESEETYKLEVKGLPEKINSVSFGIEKVYIRHHINVEEGMSMRLISPDGTSVLLYSIKGCYFLEEIRKFSFSDQGEKKLSISTKGEEIKNFLPLESLGEVNNGQNPNGIWKLNLTGEDLGDLMGEEFEWSITFGANPAKPFPFTSSTLPILKINSDNKLIPDEPKLPVELIVIANDQGKLNYVNDTNPQYRGKAGIEQRGSSSLGFPMKSYGLCTYGENWDKMDVSLLGMPAETDWVLYAPYRDKSLLRNSITYKLASDMGYYAPRNVFCELVLNGKYQGIYVLIEKVKRGKNRVNISKLSPSDSTGDALTGGYLFKIDRYNGNDTKGWDSRYAPYSNLYGQKVTYVYDYPGMKKITPKQEQYIQAYVDSFETCFFQNYKKGQKKYTDFIDLNSFIDFFIITELSKNFDGFRASAFMYKDRNSKGGKLFAGPVWDYDFAWHNSKTCSMNNLDGWAMDYGHDCFGDGMQAPFWWDCMLSDAAFAKPLRKRWNELRKTILTEKYFNSYIDSTLSEIKEAEDRHYMMWPSKENISSDQISRTRTEEIEDLKRWISRRLVWMDENLPK